MTELTTDGTLRSIASQDLAYPEEILSMTYAGGGVFHVVARTQMDRAVIFAEDPVVVVDLSRILPSNGS